jgi:hypothetical protein
MAGRTNWPSAIIFNNVNFLMYRNLSTAYESIISYTLKKDRDSGLFIQLYVFLPTPG